MSYQVLARKYRPSTFDRVIGQDHITRTLKNAVDAGRIAHGILFAGMRGVGKTTLARILAKALNCDRGPTPVPCDECRNCQEISQGYSVDVIEIDGASNTSVDDVRELREKVLYAPASTRYKIYIIDEVHMLSKSAFNALLKTLEEPPAHVIFVFATTELNRVPVTIQSRCQCFHFRRIPQEQVAQQLLWIAEQEGFGLDRESAGLIARASEGSMRDAQSLLDQVLSFSGDRIRIEDTRVVLGTINQAILNECMEALIRQDAEAAMNLVENLHSQGVGLVEFCGELQGLLRNLFMIKTLKNPEAVTPLSEEEIRNLRPLADRIEEDRLVGFIEQLLQTEEEIRRSTHPRTALEMALVRMTQLQPIYLFREILTQLEKMEQRLDRGKNPASRAAPVREGQAAEKENSSGSAALSSKESSFELDWEEMTIQANQVNPIVGAVLEHGFLEKADSDHVLIGFKKKIHYDMAKEKEDKIFELLGALMPRRLKIKFSLHNGSESLFQTVTEKKREQKTKQKARLKKESLDNNVVQDALRIFNGKIVEVREDTREPEGR